MLSSAEKMEIIVKQKERRLLLEQLRKEGDKFLSGRMVRTLPPFSF